MSVAGVKSRLEDAIKYQNPEGIGKHAVQDLLLAVDVVDSGLRLRLAMARLRGTAATNGEAEEHQRLAEEAECAYAGLVEALAAFESVP